MTLVYPGTSMVINRGRVIVKGTEYWLKWKYKELGQNTIKTKFLIWRNELLVNEIITYIQINYNKYIIKGRYVTIAYLPREEEFQQCFH